MMRTTAFDLFNAFVESGWKWCAEESAWKRGDYRLTSEAIDDLLEMHRWFLPSLIRAVREGMVELRCEVEGFSAEFFVVYEERDLVQPDCTPEKSWTRLPDNEQGRPAYFHEKTGIVFVECPAGSFVMGSPESDDEKPPHEVTFAKPFLIAKTEVTQAQWQKVMGGNPSKFQKGGDHPVEQVSWDDCQGFLKKTGLRLPSESQWEYACRAGSTGKWCCGDDESRLKEYADYGRNYSEGHQPVAKRKPNAWGIHDMHGSVWEWCQDGWHNSYQGAPADGSAWDGGPGASLRVFRGGSFDDVARYCRSAIRRRLSPGDRSRYLGFRPAADVPYDVTEEE
jgi:formylglycine-generating enzyme required for sulfatase activity